MDEHENPLNDETLDRELQRALGVGPSPEFEARVRMRVAGESMAAPWWSFRWRYVAGAAAIAAVAVLAVVSGVRPQRTVRVTNTQQQARNTLPSLSTPAAPNAIAAAPPHLALAHPAPAHPARAHPAPAHPAPSGGDPAPDVLVPPGEEQAIRMFAAAAWGQQHPAPAITAADEPLQIAPVDITPLEIEPLPQMAAMEGERP